MDGNAKVERERRWRGYVKAWRSSGLNQAAFCRRAGLKGYDFSWWKREIARRDATTAVAPAFVPVCISPPQSAPYAFELSLRCGRVLRFDERVDPGALNSVVSALEAAGLKPGAGSC